LPFSTYTYINGGYCSKHSNITTVYKIHLKYLKVFIVENRLHEISVTKGIDKIAEDSRLA